MKKAKRARTIFEDFSTTALLADWTLVTPKTTGHSVVVVPTRRPRMKWQNRVAREIGRNGLCRRRMNLHHFVGVGEDRLYDGISEVSGRSGRAIAKL